LIETSAARAALLVLDGVAAPEEELHRLHAFAMGAADVVPHPSSVHSR
jgi:hypothetical protein